MRRGLAACALVLLAGSGSAGPPQAPPREEADEVKTRRLWDDAFGQQRPPRASARRASPAAPAGRPEAASFVGVTLWRLRPPAADDDPDAAPVVSSGGERWVAERIDLDTPLAEAQRVRLAVESSRPGYLYVIDREAHDDGHLGEPYLIFPTRRIRGGDNRIRAGRLVEVPDALDRPPFFTLKRSQSSHVGESLTILVTPDRLPDVTIGEAPVRLEGERVKEWERRWSAPTQAIGLSGGAGRPYSRAEQEAGAATRLLTQEDPLPQTLFRVESAAGSPVLVVLPLRLSPRR